jgi:hypothetical protein
MILVYLAIIVAVLIVRVNFPDSDLAGTPEGFATLLILIPPKAPRLQWVEERALKQREL